MQTHINLIGQKFGFLTPVLRLSNNKHNRIIYLCKCDCGKEKVVLARNLRTSTTSSCGCQTKNLMGKKKRKDFTNQIINGIKFIRMIKIKDNTCIWECLCYCGNIFEIVPAYIASKHTKSCGCSKKGCQIKNLTGLVFGKLTVIEQDFSVKKAKLYWKCKCACGTIKTISGDGLVSGNSKSCGCYRKESASIRGKKYKGKNNHKYRHDLSEEDRSLARDRTLITGYREWSFNVKKRDNFICQSCKILGGDLRSHHIENFSSNKESRLELYNGICLCETCHKRFHKLYGRTNNTRQQLRDFLLSKQ